MTSLSVLKKTSLVRFSRVVNFHGLCVQGGIFLERNKTCQAQLSAGLHEGVHPTLDVIVGALAMILHSFADNLACLTLDQVNLRKTTTGFLEFPLEDQPF